MIDTSTIAAALRRLRISGGRDSSRLRLDGPQLLWDYALRAFVLDFRGKNFLRRFVRLDPGDVVTKGRGSHWETARLSDAGIARLAQLIASEQERT